MDKGMKYLALAIVLAAAAVAVTYRYEFSGNGGIRSDRLTGKTETECGLRGEHGWKTMAECDAIDE